MKVEEIPVKTRYRVTLEGQEVQVLWNLLNETRAENHSYLTGENERIHTRLLKQMYRELRPSFTLTNYQKYEAPDC